MADYLKIPEIARRLDVSEKTARRYVKDGTLPSVFVGGAYRVSEEDLEDYLQDARVQPGKAPAPLQLQLEEPAGLSDGWAESYAELGRELVRSWEERGRRLDVLLRAFVHSLPEERRAKAPFSRIFIAEYAEWVVEVGAVVEAYVKGVLGKGVAGLHPGLDRVCDQMLRLWPEVQDRGRALLNSVTEKDDPEIARFRERLEAQGAPDVETRFREAVEAQGPR